jgi:uncharacterized lipoprotein YmbA
MRRTTLFFRCLPVIAASAFIFLGSCLGKSQSTRFYALTPLPEGQEVSKGENPARNAAVGIGPIKLADYLDQSNLVTRKGDNRLVQAEYDQWAGSLKDNVTNVLAENIGLLLPTERIYIYPWRRSVTIDYQIVLDVVRCDGQLGEEALLVARWSLLRGQESKLLATSRSSIREPLNGSDYAALVTAQSRAVGKLSQEIVEAIQAASQGKLSEQ